MQKAARILCLQQSSVFESYGGAEYYMDDLLTSASRILGSGHVKTLVPKRTGKFQLTPRPYSIEVVPFKKSGFLSKFENRYSWDFFWTAHTNAIDFAPTMLLCAHVSLAPLAWLLSKWTGLPYFVIALGIETWGDLLPHDEWALKHATGIVSISEWTKNVLVKRGYDEKRISVVHPTLNEFFEGLPLPAKQVQKTEPLRLLTISRLSEAEQYKGQDHVLQALAKIRKQHPYWALRYTIQGEGADRQRLEEMAKKLELSDWVTFQTAVRDRNELQRLYESTDLFVMPSRFGKWKGKWRGEGFGIVYVEAGVFGVPSIAYNCGGATDIIESEKTGVLVEPDNVEALADTIARFYENRELILKMGTLAHEAAKSKFSPRSMAVQLQRFLGQSV